jgi:PAS domain S-box-containing protein
MPEVAYPAGGGTCNSQANASRILRYAEAYLGYLACGMSTGAVEVDFRVLFEKLPGLFLVLDPHFFVLAASDKYLQATMTRREDVVGQHLFDVFPDESPVKGVCNLRSSLDRVLRERAPDPMAVQRYDLRRPDGEMEERYWSVVNTPVLDASGDVEYVIHAVEDVTEFVQLRAGGSAGSNTERTAALGGQILSRSEELGAVNEQLKTANEELALRTAELHDSLQTMQTFTYSIAHDLRSPLRALMSFSSIVINDYSAQLDAPGRECLERIRAAARRMDMLVCDLLAYGQVTQVEVTAVPIGLEQAVTRALHDMHGEISARAAEVEVRRPLPTVVGNVMLLNQVLVNLLDNALKFVPSDRKPHLTIFSQQEDKTVRLCIQDNGIGIDPAYHGRVFDLFARLHKPSEYSGTGIGLALVKKAMERMMGKVGVDSTPGEGSCFWLEFRAGR